MLQEGEFYEDKKMNREKPKSFLTKDGYLKLSKEHEHLVSVVRPEVVEKITIAAAEGDRSENAEYIYGKKRLRELDRKIRYLYKLLDKAKVVDTKLLSGSQVCFGSTVTVEIDEDEGRQKTWIIVGEGETDHLTGKIDWRSPVAKALIGKKVGSVVEAQTPKGEVTLKITDLSFK